MKNLVWTSILGLLVSIFAITPAHAEESLETPPAPAAVTDVAQDPAADSAPLLPERILEDIPSHPYPSPIKGSTGNWMVDAVEDFRKIGTERLRRFKDAINRIKTRYKERENKFDQLEEDM